MKRALIIGSSGTIGRALAEAVTQDYELVTISRDSDDNTNSFYV